MHNKRVIKQRGKAIETVRNEENVTAHQNKEDV